MSIELLPRKREYQGISISNEFGGLEGYVVNTSLENLENWMKKKNCSSETLGMLRSTYKRVAIISNLYVDDEHRGKGHGTEILQEILEKAGLEGAEAILLEADTGETNAFNLVEWYESFDFEMLEGDRSKYPLMIYRFEG